MGWTNSGTVRDKPWEGGDEIDEADGERLEIARLFSPDCAFDVADCSK